MNRYLSFRSDLKLAENGSYQVVMLSIETRFLEEMYEQIARYFP